MKEASNEAINKAVAIHFLGWRQLAYEFTEGWYRGAFVPPTHTIDKRDKHVRWATNEPDMPDHLFSGCQLPFPDVCASNVSHNIIRQIHEALLEKGNCSGFVFALSEICQNNPCSRPVEDWATDWQMVTATLKQIASAALMAIQKYPEAKE